MSPLPFNVREELVSLMSPASSSFSCLFVFSFDEN